MPRVDKERIRRMYQPRTYQPRRPPMRNSITTRQGHLARTFGEGMNGVSSIEFVGWDAVPDEWIDEPHLPLYVASGITPDEWKAACAAIWKMRQEATDA